MYRKIAVALIGLAVAIQPSLKAQTTSTTLTRSYNFLPFGLASTETVQVNVVNLASNSSTGTAASCVGSISFINAAGNVIGTSTSFTVTAGQLFSASLPFAKVSTSTARTVIRASVTLTTPATSRPPCALVSSVETFDTTTGVTHQVEGMSSAISDGYGR